ncbi:MAG TPA: outer membrane lipoprotein carrier protein LolA [Pseudolabrys sp.]|nr:outer membrane lipoprotein carrier protein LolA [Pseudolabrys sp.]
MSRTAIISAAILLATALPGAAQSSSGQPTRVIVNHAAPKAKPAQSMTVAQRAAPPMQAEPPPIQSNPFASLFGKTAKAGQNVSLTAEQRALVDKINAYMSSMQVLNGDFVQVGPDGKKTQGTFYIQKPGKVRFEYDPPSPMELISDGQSVVVRDRNLATQDLYPLSQTPLRFLLADRVNLLRDTKLIAVYADDVFITAVVEETNGIVGTSRLMIMFSAKDMQLKQWTVTDPQGYDTTVAVYNLDSSKRADPSMFRIDYTRNIQ